MQAMADGDEAAYRRATVIESPEGYSDASTRMAFASYRLHRAVRDHKVTSRSVDNTGRDREKTLSVGEPMPDEHWEQARAAIAQLEWKIEGDVAEPVDAPWLDGGSSGDLSFRRAGGGWTAVLSDPVKTAPAEHLRQFAQEWSAFAASLDAATEKVKAGELRTVRQVNDFLDAQQKNRRPN